MTKNKKSITINSVVSIICILMQTIKLKYTTTSIVFTIKSEHFEMRLINMLQNFQTVGEQVFILFVLIGVGFVCGKLKLLKQEAISCLTDLILTLITPAVIIQSFQREFEPALLYGLFLSIIAAIIVHIVNILLGRILIHDKDKSKERVLRFCIIFSNCGFMALPLQGALLGSLGIFYGAAFIAVFYGFAWSYGLILISGDKTNISFKQILFSPGIVGVILGLFFFLSSVKLPYALGKPLEYIASMNTPLPMLVIGYHLSNAKFTKYLNDFKFLFAIFIRLVLAPLLALAGMLLLGIKGDLMLSSMISASTPVAALATMFAYKYKQDAEISVSLVSVSTFISILTLPFIVGIAEFFAS